MIATDIKTKIPEGWTQEKLGNLFDIIAGQAPHSIYYNDKGLGFPFLKVNSFGVKFPEVDTWTTKSLRDSKEGDVLFSVAGSIGFVNYGINASITRSIFALRPKNNKISQEYLYYLMNYISPTLSNFAGGSAQKVIGKVPINKFEFPIPNLLEQQKITEVLTTIDEAIEKTDAIIEKNKRIKQGLMQDLFRYGIDEHGNIRSEKTHKFKTVNIGRDEIRIPEEWEVKTLLDAIGGNNEQIVAGPFGSNLKVSDYIDSGVPILRLQNINANKFIDKDIKYLSPFKANLLKYHSFVGGDIALAKLGDPVGETCIIPKKFTFGIVVADVVRIRVNKKYSDEKYITYILNSDYARLQLYLNVSGTTRPRVNLSHIRNMKFVFPKAEEQIRIASMLNLIDKNIDEDEIYKQKYLSLKRGLMEDLLTGKVRVNRLITN